MENEGNAKHRSVIYPRCGNYRELARQLVFILTLSALVVPKPGCFDLIGRFNFENQDKPKKFFKKFLISSKHG